ncbi:MAG: universal stress protein [Thermoflexales bacterium]
MMIQRVLVPLDGSDMAAQVLPHVRALATLFGARVTLMRATADEAPNQDIGPGPDFLAFAAADLASSGIAADTLVTQGRPADAILDTAAQQSVDLIAMCTHGRGGIRRFVLGSVAASLIGNTSMPLLLVRGNQASVDDVPTQTIDYRKILVPLDGSPLAASVLPLVTEIAAKAGATIVLLRAMPEPNEEAATTNSLQMLRSITGVKPDSADGTTLDPYAVQLEREREGAQSSLDLAADGLKSAGVKVDTIVAFGPAAETILQVALTQQADFIAMATHGRSGLTRFLLGSVADRIVRYSRIPVLLNRAPGAPKTD